MQRLAFLSMVITLFVASVSMTRAADLPVKASPQPVTSYNWSGLYGGAHIGGGWISSTATFTGTTGTPLDPAGTSYGIDHSGFLGGLQLGYDYQMGNWVVGIGGDFSWISASQDTVTSGSLIAGSVIHSQVKTDWLATLTGRVGYAWNNWLLYAKGGAGWIHQTYGGYATSGGVTAQVNDVTDTRAGWTVGGGVEWGFWRNWSAFLEYDYLDFGTKSYTLTSTFAVSTYDVKTSASELKAGVNYRF
jgi:outer membrane immunogenic protein